MKGNLTDILYEYKDRTFEYGKLDCCIFAGEVIEKFHGKEFPENWKRVLTYKSLKESMKAVRELGGKEILDLPTLVLGVPRKDISDVKLGDMVYWITEEGHGTLGVCNGVRAYFISHKGITARPIENCLYCWSFE